MLAITFSTPTDKYDSSFENLGLRSFYCAFKCRYDVSDRLWNHLRFLLWYAELFYSLFYNQTFLYFLWRFCIKVANWERDTNLATEHYCSALKCFFWSSCAGWYCSYLYLAMAVFVFVGICISSDENYSVSLYLRQCQSAGWRLRGKSGIKLWGNYAQPASSSTSTGLPPLYSVHQSTKSECSLQEWMFIPLHSNVWAMKLCYFFPANKYMAWVQEMLTCLIGNVDWIVLDIKLRSKLYSNTNEIPPNDRVVVAARGTLGQWRW